MKNFNKIHLVFLAIVLFASCGGSKYRDIKTAINKEVVFYTTEIDYNSTLKKNNSNLKFGDRLMAREILLPVKITIKGAVYCSELKDVNIDEQNKTIQFTLPDARFEIDAVKIDWENAESKIGILRQDFSAEEYEELAKEAKDNCSNDVLNNLSKYQLQAKDYAQKSLTELISSFGYTSTINY
ncbi:MAG: DUF4230 domain-containing protein [Bacteroidales bacterium]|nr:DUF4230 domain-containing protein [Bacteroidales bacterium]